MFNYLNAHEQEDWKEIKFKLNKLLNRDVSYEQVTTTLLEFINLYEQQQNEIQHLHNQIMELKGEVTVMNAIKREGN